jgi:hypothetical protein
MDSSHFEAQLIIFGSVNEQIEKYIEFQELIKKRDPKLAINTLYVNYLPGVGCSFTLIDNILNKEGAQITIKHNTGEILLLIYCKRFDEITGIYNMINKFGNRIRAIFITNKNNAEMIDNLKEKGLDYYTCENTNHDRFSFGNSNNIMLVDQKGTVRYIAKKYSEQIEAKLGGLLNNMELPNDDF